MAARRIDTTVIDKALVTGRITSDEHATMIAELRGAVRAHRRARKASGDRRTAPRSAVRGPTAAQVVAAARRAEKFGERKAFIASVADTLGVSVQDISDHLVQLHLDGEIHMARADLVPAMDRNLVDRSEVAYENATFHFVEVPRGAAMEQRQDRAQRACGRQVNDLTARRVMDAARRAEKFGHRKAYIASVADGLGVSVQDIGDHLVQLHLDGEIRMARADVVAIVDRELFHRSEIAYENATFHFIEVA